jgi:transketolase
LEERLESFGARVFKVNGHDIDELIAPSKVELNGRPLVVLCYTNPYQGIEILKEYAPKFHYIRFKTEAERQRLSNFLKETYGNSF